MTVKSTRWDYVHGFEQCADHIVNKNGPWSDEELYEKHVTEVYSSMLLKEKFFGKHRFSATMSFDHLMAPLMVIAPELGKSADGRHCEFRRHHEIVLYNEGINVWRYDWNGKTSSWVLAAFLRSPFEAKRRYELSVTVGHSAHHHVSVALSTEHVSLVKMIGHDLIKKSYGEIRVCVSDNVRLEHSGLIGNRINRYVHVFILYRIRQTSVSYPVLTA